MEGHPGVPSAGCYILEGQVGAAFLKVSSVACLHQNHWGAGTKMHIVGPLHKTH